MKDDHRAEPGQLAAVLTMPFVPTAGRAAVFRSTSGGWANKPAPVITDAVTTQGRKPVRCARWSNIGALVLCHQLFFRADAILSSNTAHGKQKIPLTRIVSCLNRVDGDQDDQIDRAIAHDQMRDEMEST
jgi:hypothetical protein